MSDEFYCLRDTDGDGNCAACARRPGGCFEKTQTDNIARLRVAWEKTTPGEWHTCLGSGEHLMTAIAADMPDNKTLLIADCLPEYAMDDGWCVEDHRPNMNFIVLAHNEFGKIMAVLEAAKALTEVDSNECTPDNFPDDDALEVLIATLSALKGNPT